MTDYIRLRKITPPETPPAGCIDIAYDTETGTLSLVDSDGGKRHLTETDSSQEITAEGFISSSGGATLTFNASNAGFSYKAASWTSNSLLVFSDSFPEGGSLIFVKPGLIAVAPDATYANDSAAATGGVAVGEIYFTGTKFRTRMA